MRVLQEVGWIAWDIPLPADAFLISAKWIRASIMMCSKIFWASGAALFVRAELFHEGKGLDTYFFAHMEEIDFCWRLQLLGYSIYACPASEVYHVGGGTLPKGNERKVFLNFRNNMIMLAKNLPKRQSFWKIPLRILMDFISAFKSLFAGQFVYFLAVGEAHLAFFKWLFFKQKSKCFSRPP